jgi:hypothetical protein
MRLPDDHPIWRYLTKDQDQAPLTAQERDQIQDRIRAYLTNRGRELIRDKAPSLDLDQISNYDLVTLGQLDAVAQHPGLNLDLAQALAMVGDQHHESLARAQHDLDHELGQAHDHGRLRELGLPYDLHLDQPSPEPAIATPEQNEQGPSSGVDRGRAGSHRRGQVQESEVDKRDDPVKWYLENVPDPDDDKWTPT